MLLSYAKSLTAWSRFLLILIVNWGLFLESTEKSLCPSHVAHTVVACHCFCSIKRLGVSLLLPGWDARPLQGYPPAVNLPVPIYTPG